MKHPFALTQVEDGVATITINNPAKLNAMSAGLQEVLREAFAELRTDNSVRAVILTEAGRAFWVGADLGSMASHNETACSLGERVAQHMHEVTNRLMLDIRSMPVPVITAVNGPPAGAGACMAMSGDVILMARSAYLYFPFINKLGIVPDMGSTWLLPRLVGRARPTALNLLGDRLHAVQAQQIGLAWACVDDDKLLSEAKSIAARLARIPAHGIAETRRAFDAAEGNTLGQQLHYEAERQSELIDGPAIAKGVRAFAERRVPRFPGR